MTHPNITPAQHGALIRLLQALIDQKAARVLVPPYAAESGFWFGGGNVVQDELVHDERGVLWLCGRYRNFGDSRTGLAAGQRGLECAIFRSDDGGQTFTKVQSWSKADLSRPQRKVLSIEGTSLHQRPDGVWELYVSSEKDIPYPAPLEPYQKPGTGVWTIDCMTGPTPDQLAASTLTSVLENSARPEYLHVKDPVVFDAPDGATAMIFCSHPFSWTSSNSGLAVRPPGASEFTLQAWEMAPRGAAWDVAATRITGRMAVPRQGLFADAPPAAIYFYDGAECLRQLDENAKAHSRPRGYSCEEIGGAFFGWDADFPHVERLSPLAPLFISPHGSGCSRYTEVLTLPDGGLFAIWQQAQPDGSQPLVGHTLSAAAVAEICG